MAPDKVTYTIRDLLERLKVQRGEAIHLSAGGSPMFEIKRALKRIKGPALTESDPYALFAIHASEDDIHIFEKDGIAAFYHRSSESTVFNFMAFRENGHVRLEIRILK